MNEPSARGSLSRGARLALIALASVAWAWSAVQIYAILTTLIGSADADWLYDWNVYHAGAVQLVDHTLYRVPLVEPGYVLSVPTFSIGPLSAAWVVPLLPLGRELGGIVFVFAMLGCLVAGLILEVKALGLRYPWAWASVILVVYLATWPYVRAELALANNNDLVFLLVTGFAATYLAGHQRAAGVLLGLAIATKVWPIALVVLLLRERRWTALKWTASVVVVQGLLILAWLGPDVLPNLVRIVFFANGPRTYPEIPQLWTSAARVAWSWWPAWGTYAVAALLLAIPARGRLGLGIGILAGLSLNANLWYHYNWSFWLGCALVLAGLGPHAARMTTRVLSARLPAAPTAPLAGS